MITRLCHTASFLAFLLPPLASGLGASVTTLYSTGFEKSQGFDPIYELVGQGGWVTDSTSTGGNGILTNFYGSAAAYVGIFPLQPKTDSLSVWRPLNYSPPPTPQLVRFSVAFAIYDSTTTNRDDFSWSAYNTSGRRLFTLDFNNEDLQIYYLLDGTNNWVDTGWSFENDQAYDLEISMRFDLNRWSATLGGSLIVDNQQITTTNALRTLGDVDASWVIYNTAKPGDNFMAFDDYQITTEPVEVLPPPQVRLLPVGRTSNGQFTLRVTGPDNTRHAVESSGDLLKWSPLRTNTITEGFFDFTDTTSVGKPSVFYRTRWVP